jgi:hypothetical protein
LFYRQHFINIQVYSHTYFRTRSVSRGGEEEEEEEEEERRREKKREKKKEEDI